MNLQELIDALEKHKEYFGPTAKVSFECEGEYFYSGEVTNVFVEGQNAIGLECTPN